MAETQPRTRTIPAQITPEERAARKQEAQVKKFSRDRARMLAHVQTCVKQAEAAIVSGDVATHDKWLSTTIASIEAYQQFVALSLAQPQAQPAPAATAAG